MNWGINILNLVVLFLPISIRGKNIPGQLAFLGHRGLTTHSLFRLFGILVIL